MARRLAKGFLKAAFKVDWDNDGSTDATLTATVPNIDLSNYFSDTSGSILIFDDLERCTGNLKEILGYINYFVEKEGYKAILIADEKKILSPEDGMTSDYHLYKEKLIGKTLKINADLEGLFDNFIREAVENLACRKFLRRQKPLIKSVFTNSAFNNLRSLKRALIEFFRVWSILEEEIRNNEDLLSKLLELLLILSMEIHAGTLKDNDLPDLFGANALRRITAKNGEITDQDRRIKEVTSKYDFYFRESLMSASIWNDLFFTGHINQEDVNLTLKNTKYFLKQNTPTWVQLWYLWDLEDDEYLILYNSVRNNFNARAYSDPGVALHVFSMLLNLSEKEIIEEKIEETIKECKEYIDNAIKEEKFTLSYEVLSHLQSGRGHGGLGYTNNESDSFREVAKYLKDRISIKLRDSLKNHKSKIVAAIQGGPPDLHDLLTNDTMSGERLNRRPILKLFDPKEFFDLYWGAPNETKNKVASAIKDRYELASNRAELSEELEWLERLADEASRQLPQAPFAVSKMMLNRFIHTLKKTVETLRENAI